MKTIPLIDLLGIVGAIWVAANIPFIALCWAIMRRPFLFRHYFALLLVVNVLTLAVGVAAKDIWRTYAVANMILLLWALRDSILSHRRRRH